MIFTPDHAEVENDELRERGGVTPHTVCIVFAGDGTEFRRLLCKLGVGVRGFVA
jgi:hypothetical protein